MWHIEMYIIKYLPVTNCWPKVGNNSNALVCASIFLGQKHSSLVLFRLDYIFKLSTDAFIVCSTAKICRCSLIDRVMQQNAVKLIFSGL